MPARDREHTGDAPLDPFELEELGAYTDSLSTEVKAWLVTQRDYHTLVASERVAKLGSGLLGGTMFWACIACALGFISLAAAILIGQRLDNMALGFLAMSGIYVLLALGLALLWRHRYRDRLTLRIFNALYHG